MIADLDETLKNLLLEEIPLKNGEAVIKFDQPTREWSVKVKKPAINFFLYDVRENVALRQHQWEKVARNGNGRIDKAHLKRTPFRVDCHYLITTWATEPDDEHRLLSRCLMALFRHPVVPEKYLTGLLHNQPFGIQGRIASHDKLTNPAEIWSALDNEIRPALSYLVTIAIDPWTEISESPVMKFTLRSGISTEPQKQNLENHAQNINVSSIGGQVFKNDEPLSGIQVSVKDTGFTVTTDERGRFQFGGLHPGTYTLIAWSEEGVPKEVDVLIPADINTHTENAIRYDIDL